MKKRYYPTAKRHGMTPNDMGLCLSEYLYRNMIEIKDGHIEDDLWEILIPSKKRELALKLAKMLTEQQRIDIPNHALDVFEEVEGNEEDRNDAIIEFWVGIFDDAKRKKTHQLIWLYVNREPQDVGLFD